MDTDELRANFICETLMQDDTINLGYSHYDRMVIGSEKPVNTTLILEKITKS